MRKVEIVDISKSAYKWTEEDTNFLINGYKAGMSIRELAIALKRSEGAINVRLGPKWLDLKAQLGRYQRAPYKNGSVNGSQPPLDMPSPGPTVQEPTRATPAQDYRIVVEGQSDPELELFMWFMARAWLEGQTIEIPALGFTFQKPKASS